MKPSCLCRPARPGALRRLSVLALLLCSVPHLYGEKIFRPPFEDAFCWTDSSLGIREARAYANNTNGCIMVWVQAIAGKATAEARQYVILYVQPESSPRNIRIQAEIYRAGGVNNFGTSEFGSDWVTLSVDTTKGCVAEFVGNPSENGGLTAESSTMSFSL